jgi:hypothetical protein
LARSVLIEILIDGHGHQWEGEPCISPSFFGLKKLEVQENNELYHLLNLIIRIKLF